MSFYKISDGGTYVDLDQVESFSSGYNVILRMKSGDIHHVEDPYTSKLLDFFSKKLLK